MQRPVLYINFLQEISFVIMSQRYKEDRLIFAFISEFSNLFCIDLCRIPNFLEIIICINSIIYISVQCSSYYLLNLSNSPQSIINIQAFRRLGLSLKAAQRTPTVKNVVDIQIYFYLVSNILLKLLFIHSFFITIVFFCPRMCA